MIKFKYGDTVKINNPNSFYFGLEGKLIGHTVDCGDGYGDRYTIRFQNKADNDYVSYFNAEIPAADLVQDTFKAGDVVTLKGESTFSMTVSAVSHEDRGEEVSCKWFDGTNLHADTFLSENLKLTVKKLDTFQLEKDLTRVGVGVCAATSLEKEMIAVLMASGVYLSFEKSNTSTYRYRKYISSTSATLEHEKDQVLPCLVYGIKVKKEDEADGFLKMAAALAKLNKEAKIVASLGSLINKIEVGYDEIALVSYLARDGVYDDDNKISMKI